MGLKDFFGKRPGTQLPAPQAARLATWQDLPAPSLGHAHFHTRYVLVDICSSGLDPSRDSLTSLAALALQGGRLGPGDAFFVELGEEPEARNEALLAFLEFTGKSPLVSFQVPYVGAFIDGALKQALGVELDAEWLDLAVLLPELFRDQHHDAQGLDDWLERFEILLPGRQEALSDTLALGRLLQRVLAEVAGRSLDTPAALFELARARRWLHGDK